MFIGPSLLHLKAQLFTITITAKLKTVCSSKVKCKFKLVSSQSHIATDDQSVSLGVESHLGLMTRY
jgi:hypothetical protein